MDLWYPGAEKIPTAAHWADMDRAFPFFRGYMIHVMQGYQTTMIRWAQERPYTTKKSAHATAGRSGRLAQHVALDSRSWAAGRSCRETWPLVDPAQGSSVPVEQRRSMNHTVVNIECEGFSKVPGYGYDYLYDETHPWPAALITAVVDFGVFFFRQTGLAPDPTRIIGHRDTDGCTRSDDPGFAFPMLEVRERIAAGVSGAPPAPPPPDPGTPSPDLLPRIETLEATQAAQDARLAAHEARMDRHLVG